MSGGVCIGVVAVGPPSWSFVGSLLKLQKPAGWMFRRVGPLAVDMARNRLCREFLAGQEEWLLMVDADAILHPATLLRLLSWEKPLVAALAFSRYGPLLPTVYRGKPGDPDKRGFVIQRDEVREWLRAHPELVSSEPQVLEPRPDEALSPVDRCGCHCVLVQRSVLEAIPPPWFQMREEFEKHGAGEDFYFFEKAQWAGIQAYVDRSTMAGHLYGDRCLAAQDWIVWDYASEFEQQ
jgi:hypothetical protein